jgi:hypothetical protein
MFVFVICCPLGLYAGNGLKKLHHFIVQRFRRKILLQKLMRLLGANRYDLPA